MTKREKTLKSKKPHIYAKLKFYTTEEGGRKAPTNHKWFGCPSIINNQYYDCILLLFSFGSINPGDTVNVPIVFINRDVLRILNEGDCIKLWDGRIIAEGIVNKIID